jgi:Rab GDP dissociation inhibitor
VIRSICILDHPIASTDSAASTQIIIPASEANRRNDIYVCMVSFAHCVAAKGKYIAIVSTTVETDDPQEEIEPGIQLLGDVLERFDAVSDTFEPLASGHEDNCYISKSYDATSHFESVADDLLDLHVRVFGEALDMSISADTTKADE